jgi:diguanylate cyclase (GGDEF)-like protein
MIESYEFLKSVIDNLTEHIVVIDNEGNILFVNRAWITFSQNNNCLINNSWIGVNYLKTCDESATMGDELSLKAAAGIRKVINSEQELFYLEYPCHSADEKRWFVMRVTPFKHQGTFCYIISHQNITERKLAEEKVLYLSRLDGLTNLPNRRYFDEFLNNEWKRCARLKMPVSLAFIDIDHFKLLNDTYGHQAGDECLRTIGAVLKKIATRPGDLCARYGGEEFSIVFSNTTVEKLLPVVNRLIETIRGLKIPNEKAPTMPIVTISIGLTMMFPDNHTDEKELINAADLLLYSAKENGRNQLAFKSD